MTDPRRIGHLGYLVPGATASAGAMVDERQSKNVGQFEYGVVEHISRERGVVEKVR